VVGEVAEGLHEGLVGDAEVLVAAAGQHGGPFVVHTGGELGGQARLPDPGLTGHESHPQFPRRRLLPQLAEPVELAVSADEDPPDVGQEGREWD
jgi:hypothetical protein